MTKSEALQALTFGQRIAEEEREQLASYFVETDLWRRMLAGEVDIVYGAKGSGKSAIYALLLDRDAAFRERGILIRAAENPRGTPVFKDLVTDAPTNENEFRALWKLYILALVVRALADERIDGRVTRATVLLEQAGLLPREASLRGLVRAALDYARGLLRAESFEGGLRIDPATGLPGGFTGKITLREPSSSELRAGLVSVDEVFGWCSDAIRDARLSIWILLDRLDVAFGESEDLERNALRAAQANLAAAEGQLTQARNHFERQDTLLKQGWTTRANHDQAKQAQQTAQSQVEAAEAQLKSAHDLVSFTELKADAPGVVTSVGPRAGEVVQAGQMIVRLARKDGRDAVFDVPAQMLRSAPSDPQITVSLTNDPSVTARGRVREVAPQANPATRTFEVKVGLTDPPEAMLLGATVTGRMEVEAVPVIEIPATALTKFNQQPAVWIVDPSKFTVSIRNVEVLRFDPASVAISEGLDTGELVVTAGVQALHPGQKVRLLGSEP